MADDTVPHLLDPNRLASVQKQLAKEIKATTKAEAHRMNAEHAVREAHRTRVDDRISQEQPQ